VKLETCFHRKWYGDATEFQELTADGAEPVSNYFIETCFWRETTAAF